MLSRRFPLLPSRRMRFPFALIVALVVVAALLTGCGGSGSDESTESVAPVTETTVALTKAELIERGDGICAEVNAALGTVGTSSSETSPAEQEAGLYSGMISSLKNLGAPQEAAGYSEFIAAAEALATAEDEVKLAAEREDTASLESVEASASSARGEFQTAAEEYGFEECGAGPSSPTTTAPESGETGPSEAPQEEAAPEEVAPEEEAPEAAPETGGAEEGGGTAEAPEEGGGTTGGSSGGIGP